MPLFPALVTQLGDGFVLRSRDAVMFRLFSREDAHDFDGVVDHVAGALLSFRACGHRLFSHNASRLRLALRAIFATWLLSLP